MGLRDAIRLSLPNRKPRELKVHIATLNQNVFLRHGTSDVFCLLNILMDREYETPFVVNPKVIIDAGANIGIATLFFSNKYPQAKIVAIEPEASNFGILTKNCGSLPNVILINAALWPTAHGLAIQNAGAEKWAFSVVEEQKSPGLGSIRSVTIPDLMRDWGIEYIDILKLDIEGAERELFNAGSDAWLGCVGQIIIELHDRLKPGCAHAFYKEITRHRFVQESLANNIFINMRSSF